MKNTCYFYAVRISILLAILSEIFVQIGYFFLRDMKEHKWLCFSEHSVCAEYWCTSKTCHAVVILSIYGHLSPPSKNSQENLHHLLQVDASDAEPTNSVRQ